MGTQFSSSKKDFNRILAQQPRESATLPTLPLPNYHQQQPLVNKFSIPEPVRFSPPLQPPPLEIPAEPEPQIAPSKPTDSAAEPPLVLPNQNRLEVPSEKPKIQKSSSFSNRSQMSRNVFAASNDAVILSRSVINLAEHRPSNSQRFTSFGPSRSIIERNGKKFATEFLERTEQRYVQCFDESQGRMRIFEVIDYIPTKVIQKINHNAPAPLTNGLLANTNLPPRIPSQVRPPSRSSDRTYRGRQETRDNVIYPSISSGHYSSDRFYDPAVALPVPKPNSSSNSSRATMGFESSAAGPPVSDPSQLMGKKLSHELPDTTSQNLPKSKTPSETAASESEEETNIEEAKMRPRQLSQMNNLDNRYNQIYPSPYGDGRENTSPLMSPEGYNAAVRIDSSSRSTRSADPSDRQRPTIASYAQPSTGFGRFAGASATDYAPIRLTNQQSIQSQYSQINYTAKSVYE